MDSNYPFHSLISALESNDVNAVKELLNLRGSLVGPGNSIDLDMDYGVYRAAVSNGSLEVLHLVVSNDRRVVPHLLNSVAKQGRVDVIERIAVLSPGCLDQLTLDRMVFYAVIGNQMCSLEYLLTKGASINQVPEAACHAGNTHLLFSALNEGAETPSDYCLSEALYHCIQQGDEQSAVKLAEMCEDPYQHCMTEDDPETMMMLMNFKPIGTKHSLIESALHSGCRDIQRFLMMLDPKL